MADKKKLEKIVPEKALKSIQYDLFSCFLSNDESEISNTVEYWERIPKYFFTPKKIKELRTSDGLLATNKTVRFYSKWIVRFIMRRETAEGGSPKPFPGAAVTKRSYAAALSSVGLYAPCAS